MGRVRNDEGGGEKGGDPGHEFAVPEPQSRGLLPKLHQFVNKQTKINYRPDNEDPSPRTGTKKKKNLIGVKREKDPVEGTSPERLLFDKSLNSKKKYMITN